MNNILQTDTALIYDAVMLFAMALDNLDQSQVSMIIQSKVTIEK